MKKRVIVLAIVIAVIVGVMLYMHYTPFWVNITTVVSFAIGAVAGWVSNVVYRRYFKKEEENK